MFFNLIEGKRRISSRESRTQVDFAEEGRRLLDEEYPHARKA